MQELHPKIAAMNGSYYGLRGEIVTAERRIATLTERLETWAQYEQHKPIRRQLDKLKPRQREKFVEQHSAELAQFEAVEQLRKAAELLTKTEPRKEPEHDR